MVLPAPFRPSTTTSVDGKINAGEHLQRAVALAEVRRRQRSLPARCGLRKSDLGDPVGRSLGFYLGQQPLRPSGHVVCCRCLGGLGSHLVGLRHQLIGFALGVLPLSPAALLVGFALRKVAPPIHGVDVELRPVGIEVKNLVDRGVKQTGIVADDEQAARVGLQKATQPDDRVCVQMVGRLVEEQRVGAGEEDPRQFHTASLPAGQCAERLVENALRKSEVAGNPRCFCLSGVATRCRQLRLSPGISGHRLVPYLDRVVGHLKLGPPESLYHRVEATGRENPVFGQHVKVTRARVLRQVSHGSGAGY